MADLLALQLLGSGWAVMASLLPCPLDAGWIKQRELEIPHHSGGYSAITYEKAAHRVWLLSDLPDGTLSAWTLPAWDAPPRLLKSVSLKVPESISQQLDGEALVIAGDQVWVATEGRRTRERPAQLLRFSLARGLLLQAVPLPPDWQASPGKGLDSNAGPESLVRLSPAGQPLELLMAAERPLLQGPADQLPLLRWFWPGGRDPRRDPPQALPQGALLAPPGGGWGLTDLLVLHSNASGPRRLLSLWRRYRDPLQWENLLRLYPLPAAGEVADALQEWDLQAMGLTPENWEGLSFGPELLPGKPSLLLVSDDNRNPLQSSRLAQLYAHRSASCTPGQ